MNETDPYSIDNKIYSIFVTDEFSEEDENLFIPLYELTCVTKDGAEKIFMIRAKDGDGELTLEEVMKEFEDIVRKTIKKHIVSKKNALNQSLMSDQEEKVILDMHDRYPITSITIPKINKEKENKRKRRIQIKETIALFFLKLSIIFISVSILLVLFLLVSTKVNDYRHYLLYNGFIIPFLFGAFSILFSWTTKIISELTIQFYVLFILTLLCLFGSSVSEWITVKEWYEKPLIVTGKMEDVIYGGLNYTKTGNDGYYIDLKVSNYPKQLEIIGHTKSDFMLIQETLYHHVELELTPELNTLLYVKDLDYHFTPYYHDQFYFPYENQ